MNAVYRKSLECQEKNISPIGATFRDISRAIRTETRKDILVAIETLMAQGKLCGTVKKSRNNKEVTTYQAAEVVEE